MIDWELNKVSDSELDELRCWLYRSIDDISPGWMILLYNDIVKEQHRRMK